jgi:hypothetical protein
LLPLLAAHPAAACDWNREANANVPVVATTAPLLQSLDRRPKVGVAQSRSVASDEGNRKPIQESAPVVLITDRH